MSSFVKKLLRFKDKFSIHLITVFVSRYCKVTKSSNAHMHTANVYRALLGVCRFSLQYPRKRNERILEKPYTCQRERLYMLWEITVIFTHCMETLDNYRISTQHTQSFPLRSVGFLCDSYSLFSIDVTGKTCGPPVILCKHLQCIMNNYICP